MSQTNKNIVNDTLKALTIVEDGEKKVSVTVFSIRGICEYESLRRQYVKSYYVEKQIYKAFIRIYM